MNHSKIELEFRESLEHDDYGLIVGTDGNLKGIWVPNTVEDNTIPDAIVDLCISKFGIDPNNSGHQAVFQ